jgi:hypothetical protein
VVAAAAARGGGGGGGSGGMIKGEDKQQSNNGCVGKWQREKNMKNKKGWSMVNVDDFGGWRRICNNRRVMETKI